MRSTSGWDTNTTSSPGAGSPTATRTVANAWEFPVLGKYAIFGGPRRPFVDAGANFRHVSRSGADPHTGSSGRT